MYVFICGEPSVASQLSQTVERERTKMSKVPEASKKPAGARVPRKTGPRRSAIPAEETSRPDRRQDILRSAELLFSLGSYHSVSVRDIAAHAGVPLALVGYYFGKKDELFKMIFEHRKAYITERIDGMLKVDCSPKNRNAVEHIIRAWAEPVVALRASAHGEPFSVLVARAAWGTAEEARQIMMEYYDPLAATFIDTMSKVLPCPRDRIVWAYEFALGALLMLIADPRVERLSRDGAKSGDPAQCDHLVAFLTAGFLSATGARK